MQKNKHLLIQIGIRVGIFFLLMSIMLGAVFYRGCMLIYLKGKEEVLDKDLVRIQQTINDVSFPALYDYWRDHPDCVQVEVSDDEWVETYQYMASIPVMNDASFQEMPDHIKRNYANMQYDVLISNLNFEKLYTNFHDLYIMDVSEEKSGFIYAVGQNEYDPDYKPLGEQSVLPEESIMEELRWGEPDNTVYSWLTLGTDNGSVMLYRGFIPLEQEGEIRRAICLEYDSTPFMKRLLTNLLILIGICLAIMLLSGTGLILYLRRSAIQPLVQIQKSVREFMDTKDSKPITEEMAAIKANNEFRVLSGDVSQLATEIDEYIRKVEESKEAVQNLTTEVMDALAHTIDANDSYTNGHSHRVAIYSRMLAKNLGMSIEEQEKIYCMGLLHDIGKIGVPGAIINKTSKLTDEEYELIKSHTIKGCEILDEIQSFPELAYAARWHHELYNGSGYPDKKAGEEIPFYVRIIAVADSYDAMTSNRSYRKYLPQDVVRGEIEKNAGKQFDPQVAACMLKIIDADKNYSLHE